MTDRSNKNDFDPEKDNAIKNGPLKPEHKNQYGEKPDEKERDMAERAKKEDGKKNK